MVGPHVSFQPLHYIPSRRGIGHSLCDCQFVQSSPSNHCTLSYVSGPLALQIPLSCICSTVWVKLHEGLQHNTCRVISASSGHSRTFVIGTNCRHSWPPRTLSWFTSCTLMIICNADMPQYTTTSWPSIWYISHWDCQTPCSTGQGCNSWSGLPRDNSPCPSQTQAAKASLWISWAELSLSTAPSHPGTGCFGHPSPWVIMACSTAGN